MARRINDHDQRDAKRRPAYIDDYILDSISGMYKRKSLSGENPEAPLHVTVRTDWKNITISLLTLLVVAGYTYYEARQFDVMEHSQQRAWIKIETDEIALEKPPFIAGFVGCVGGCNPKDPPDHIGIPNPNERYPDPYPGIVFETDSFPIKVSNFSNFPARQSVILASVMAQPEDSMRGSPLGDWWIDFACERAQWRLETSPFQEPFFPGKQETTVKAETILPAEMHKVVDLSIAVCIQYQEVYGSTHQFHRTDMHHTAVLYCAETGSGQKTISSTTQDGELVYPPIVRFHACQADAD